MKNLPPIIMKKVSREPNVRHISGIYNSIWTDMFIESSYMLVGHSPGGARGLENKENQMTVWALSHATCGKLSRDVHEMGDSEPEHIQSFHKEEDKARMTSDVADREQIGNILQHCIDPLDSKSTRTGP